MFKPTEEEIAHFIEHNKALHPGLHRAQALGYMRNRYNAIENTKAMREAHTERQERMARTPVDYAIPARHVVVREAASSGIAHAALWFGLGLMIGGVL